MHSVKEKAYAKINLHLDVVAKRDDGFHDIKTVMHSISLCDELTVSYTPSKKTQVRLFVSGNKFLPTDNKNLAVRAALLYLDRAKIVADVTISLKKKIPVAAGLAGGSSDAAATLRAMNRIFGRVFTESALLKMAAELGSDVPYCLIGKTALCEGRGEIITRLPENLKLHTVVAIGKEHVSTPAAYSALDEIYSDFDGNVKSGAEERYAALSRAIVSGEPTADMLFNIFEQAVLPKCSAAVTIKESLYKNGALCALMSGSGPSVFGVFETEDGAKRALDNLVSLGYTAEYATSV